MRLYYGGYGHNPSGKQYVYYGGDNFRTGQHVVAPVRHPISKKLYNTMFTIQRTGALGHKKNDLLQRTDAQKEVDNLEASGVEMKSLGGRDTLSLPTGQRFENKASWERASNMIRQESIAQRLASYSKANDISEAKNRLRNY